MCAGPPGSHNNLMVHLLVSSERLDRGHNDKLVLFTVVARY